MNTANILDEKMSETIDKTILTANLFDGFWDRWIVHGVQRGDLSSIRTSYLTKEKWIHGWNKLAKLKFSEAENLERKGILKEAEIMYRTSALYYQLIQWLIPDNNKVKLDWLNTSLDVVRKSDNLSTVQTDYVQLPVDQHTYFGRVRVPSQSRGVIIIINPLDSTKEELFTYEMDFLEKGFTTVSFDGPGQGQTYAVQGLRGSKLRWEVFVDRVIDYVDSRFINEKIYLFGTSSGGAWAIYGSCNQKVSKAVAVSPAFRTNDIKMPDYFLERVHFVTEEEEALPSYEELALKNPILLVHGKKDVMVKDEDIYRLYEKLPKGKAYLEYEEEGHCCNYVLPEIRQKAIEWFDGNEGIGNEL